MEDTAVLWDQTATFVPVLLSLLALVARVISIHATQTGISWKLILKKHSRNTSFFLSIGNQCAWTMDTVWWQAPGPITRVLVKQDFQVRIGSCFTHFPKIEWRLYFLFLGLNCEISSSAPSPTIPPNTACSVCQSNPCFNNGVCIVNSFSTYTCLCPANYYGTNCQFTGKLNPCSPNPCLNGATCALTRVITNGVNYVCTCCDGWSGQACQIRVSPYLSPLDVASNLPILDKAQNRQKNIIPSYNLVGNKIPKDHKAPRSLIP